ncbi:Hypothetical protein, putative [Bodo saltans]|uniref:Uncharacterized protein n=1 Tax=Bodo saltans TaxID=75058 RepID=A0A0S4J5H4_BODSA|nr:Hypothetical protein, putative [Bodo saltans]|eukprot:CUG84815.1 Hypothetical protein, putative [Bodo saltans]
MFCHNPYATSYPVAPEGLEPPLASTIQIYGATWFHKHAARNDLVRLFVGQVPYHLEPAHVVWMLQHLSGRRVLVAEKIVKWTQSCKPCGCFHVYCAPEDADAILLLDQKVLCEESGLWHARNDEEARHLADRCKHLKESSRTLSAPSRLLTVTNAHTKFSKDMNSAMNVGAFHHQPVPRNTWPQAERRSFSRQQQQATTSILPAPVMEPLKATAVTGHPSPYCSAPFCRSAPFRSGLLPPMPVNA